MSTKIKTDLILGLSLLMVLIPFSFYNWSNTEFKTIDLTNAELSCERYKSKFQGYFHLNGITFYSAERYNNLLSHP